MSNDVISLLQTYFRSETTICVLSMMTGLAGGMNLGGSLLFTGARQQWEVDIKPANKENKAFIRYVYSEEKR